MTPALTDHTVPFAGRLHREDCNIDDLAALVAHRTDLAEYPYAHSVADGVLLYHSAALVEQSSNPETRAEIQDEIARALLTGPGITVFQGAFDAEILDRASVVFRELIARQHESGAASGDHFAKPGANDRIWGAQLKLALEYPKAYVDYYANSIVALASEAWLGPMYQVTSDVNVVNPGGAAQNPHRDYHLGFMSSDVAAKFRAHVHRLTPALTLQGAVAHVDMPAETGPTKYLPYSQQFESGYLAFERPRVQGVLRSQLRPIAFEEGRCRLLQPSPVPRGRPQQVLRRPAYGKSPTGVVGLRSSPRNHRPGGTRQRDLSGTARPQRSRFRRVRSLCRRRLGRGLRLPDQSGPRPTDRRPRASDAGRTSDGGGSRADLA